MWFIVVIHYTHTPHLDLIELCVLLILIPLLYTQFLSSFVKVIYPIPNNWYQSRSESNLYSEVLWWIFCSSDFDHLLKLLCVLVWLSLSWTLEVLLLKVIQSIGLHFLMVLTILAGRIDTELWSMENCWKRPIEVTGDEVQWTRE